MRNGIYQILNIIVASLVLAAGIVPAGCSSKVNMVQPPFMPLPESPVYTEAGEHAEEGTIFQEASAYTDLFVNPKAKRVGDIITIRIVENSSAKNNAATNTGRSSTLTARTDAFFNLENRFADSQTSFNPFGSIIGGIDSEFAGKGTTSRSGDLSAYITARVVSAHPNGNLVISGTREVQINHEKQYITLQGVIRPRDISPDNVILSTYISDARIAYSGTGVVDQRQKPGWASNFLNKAWPF